MGYLSELGWLPNNKNKKKKKRKEKEKKRKEKKRDAHKVIEE